jgi:hypothetical protein
MNVQWIIRGLNEPKRDFRRILDDDASYVIDEAIAEVENSKKAFDARQGKTHHPGLAPRLWGYNIYPEAPLRFRPSKNAIKGLNLWIDICCKVLWGEEGALPVEQVIHLRVWSDELDFIYRENWDSKEIYDKLTDGRVMLRCHFDFANPGQPGPTYHIQFGGNARQDELCWFPEALKLPRLAYPPMDLILVCQLVAANFYWGHYDEFRQVPEWKTIVRQSQKCMLRGYYGMCSQVIEQDQILLDRLWNI